MRTLLLLYDQFMTSCMRHANRRIALELYTGAVDDKVRKAQSQVVQQILSGRTGLAGMATNARKKSTLQAICVQHVVLPKKPFFLARPERDPPPGNDKLQYPAKSSVRMSSSSTPALTSIALMPATMAGGPAL